MLWVAPMKSTCLLVVALALGLASFAAGCQADEVSTDAAGAAATESDLTSFAAGTFVVDSKPYGNFYIARITFAAGKTYEADVVSSDGKTSISKGTYDTIAARPNNPSSPVKSDKPVLFLRGGYGSPPSLEFDKLSDGGIKFYYAARQTSFTMKKDPSWKPAPTNVKAIACTGERVTAEVRLDQAQNRAGTLTIKRKSGATSKDPPAVTDLPITETGSDRERTRFEGSKGDNDYFINIKAADFARGTGTPELYLRWATDGQEFSVSVSCAFTK